MNLERKVREEKVQENNVQEGKFQLSRDLTCAELYIMLNYDTIANADVLFPRLTCDRFDWKYIYRNPPIGCSKANIVHFLFQNYYYMYGRVNYPEFLWIPYEPYLRCYGLSGHLGFQPRDDQKITRDNLEAFLRESELINDPFELLWRYNQVTASDLEGLFPRNDKKIVEMFAMNGWEHIKRYKAEANIEARFFKAYYKSSECYVLMSQCIEQGLSIHNIRQRILAANREILDKLLDQNRRGVVENLVIQNPNDANFWNPNVIERGEQLIREAKEEVERQRRIQAEQREAERRRREEQKEESEFWQPVRKPSVKTRMDIFNTGRNYPDFGKFQFFFLDDVKRVWGDNPPFHCDNPIDAITQDPILEPLADSRILIYFYPEQGIVECWDIYGLSAYCAMVLEGNNFPRHPLTKIEFTKSTIALLGFAHGILRASDEGLGVKRKYAQEVFEKYQKETADELKALEAQKVVEATFNNPTIAYKRMICERKHWYEDDKTPPGLCSAQPLKDFLDLKQYETELQENVAITKQNLNRGGQNNMGNNSSSSSDDGGNGRNPATRRTVTGADLPDPNQNGGPFRRINE